MSYSPPANLSAEDAALEVALVETYRGIIKALRDRLSEANDEPGLNAWRWRVNALTVEARASLAHLKGES